MSTRSKKAVSQVIGTIAMVLVALALGAVLIILTGESVGNAYGTMIRGAFGTPRKITELFVKLIPILLMAFGVSIAYRAKLWNIGAEGQFVMSSIAGAAVAIYLPVPIPLRLILSFIASVGAGALWAGLAGWLKNRFNANEVITTLMLNYIATYFLLYLINGPMQDPFSDLPQSDIIPESMRLPFVVPNSRLHIGIFFLILAIILMIFFWKTTLGYRIDLIGQGEKVATYAGINVKRTVLVTMLISGAFCGLAGWLDMFGIQFRVLDGIAGDYGDIATIIALLGSLNPYGVMAAAAFFSVLLCGGASMQRMTEVPYSVVDVIEGLIIILVIARNMFAEQLSGITKKKPKARKEAKEDGQ